jgi:hypothetical protein
MLNYSTEYIQYSFKNFKTDYNDYQIWLKYNITFLGSGEQQETETYFSINFDGTSLLMKSKVGTNDS